MVSPGRGNKPATRGQWGITATMDGGVRQQGVYLFGPFRLDPVARAVTQDGVRVPLTARLFDTLFYLVQNPGRLVERDELTQAVWPGRIVEDSNVAKAVSALRIALRSDDHSEGFIVTAPGRGYRFGAPVLFEPSSPEAVSSRLPQRAEVAADPATALVARHRHTWTKPQTVLAACIAIIGICVGVFEAVPPRRSAEHARPFAPPPRSVVVLPFSHVFADEEFSDGVSEELINALGRVGTLRVTGRLSSFSFEGKQASIGDIARQLNVATVLEGSVHRDGARIRVTAQLVDSTTGYQIWAQEYDGDAADRLALEQRISEAVIGSLKIVLAGKDAAMLTLGGTTDPRAFDAYLTGMASLARTDVDTNDEAIAAFGTAIADDPRYAMAYAQRARAVAYRAVTTATPDLRMTEALLDAARRDAEKAVAIAPDLGAAHAALALVLKLSLTRFDQVQQELRRAITLSPSDVTIVMDFGFFELDLGHTAAAAAAAERAVTLDPLTPNTYKMLSEILAYARRFDEAETALRHAAALRPDDADGRRLYVALIQQFKGDAAGARRSCTGGRDYRELTCLAWADHTLGRQEEAEAALARLHAMAGLDCAYQYARIAAQWGDTKAALRWLQTAYDTHDAGLIALRSDPFMGPVRDTPTYRHIEQALGFPP